MWISNQENKDPNSQSIYLRQDYAHIVVLSFSNISSFSYFMRISTVFLAKINFIWIFSSSIHLDSLCQRIYILKKKNYNDQLVYHLFLKPSRFKKCNQHLMVKMRLSIGFPDSSVDKESTWVRFLGWEDSLEKRKATHSSILAMCPRGCKESDMTEWLSLSLAYKLDFLTFNSSNLVNKLTFLSMILFQKVWSSLLNSSFSSDLVHSFIQWIFIKIFL